MDTLVDNVFVPVIPFTERFDKTLLVHVRDVVDQFQQFFGGIQLGLLGEVAPDHEHLVELAQLYREWEGLCESPHPVDDSTVYPEALGSQPSHTLDVVRYRLVCHILPPWDFLPKRVFDDHQPEVPAPIGRVHLDGNFLVLRDFLDIAHAFKVAADGFA